MNKNKFISKIDKRFLYGIAHRGYHDETNIENGMNAFKRAIDSDIAFEYDIHLTKDNQLLVCHDSDLVRTCGKNGIIEELNLSDIKENYKLNNGEEIPSFEQVLQLNNEKVPMVIELKTYNRNHRKLIKAFKEVMSKYVKDYSKYIIISFDPRALILLRNTKYLNSLLICKEHFWARRLLFLFDSLDIDFNLLNVKDIQRYYKKHFVNCWTIENETNLDICKKYCDTVTFQHIDCNKVKETLINK